MDEVVEQEQYIDIHPLKKGKRALVFLGDFFLLLVFSLLLFHVGTYPLGRYIVRFDDQLTSLRQAQVRRDAVLYGHELLFARDGGNKDYGDFETNLEYTSGEYIHCHVDETYPQKYDVFAHYFVDIRQDETAYVSFMKDLDERYGFFDFSGGLPKLKETFVEEFKPMYDEKDTMSTKGVQDQQTFENKIFVQGYAKLLADLQEKDLTYEGNSYASEQKVIDEVLKNSRSLIMTCSLVTLLTVWIILHLLIPTLSKKRKTIGMMMMRVERIHKSNFDYLSLPMTYLSSLYSLAASALLVLFIPWGTTDFNELFSLPVLFPVALFSLAYLIGSLAFMLFDPFNRTLGDFLCQSYFLGMDDFDHLIRERGYGQ